MLERLLSDVTPEVGCILDGALSGREPSRADALRLLRAGTSDWGGVSPVTVDFINPEAPWPTLRELRARTQAAGQRLVERLPVYPQYFERPGFFAPELLPVARGFADETGYARTRASLEAA